MIDRQTVGSLAAFIIEPILSGVIQRSGDRSWTIHSQIQSPSSKPHPAGTAIRMQIFIIEPILSGGGILELPKGYLTRLSEECKKRGIVR
jgi:4-aminobutyrate aminotransferase-like enzyme